MSESVIVLVLVLVLVLALVLVLVLVLVLLLLLILMLVLVLEPLGSHLKMKLDFPPTSCSANLMGRNQTSRGRARVSRKGGPFLDAT
jgi:O-antigen ligase